MKGMFAIATSLLLAAGVLTACDREKVEEAKPAALLPEDAALAKVRKTTSTPDSVQFRNVAIFRGGAVCGEFRSKNAVGEYGGYKPFVAAAVSVVVDDYSWNKSVCNDEMFKNISLFRTLSEECTATQDELETSHCTHMKKMLEEQILLCSKIYELDCRER